LTANTIALVWLCTVLRFILVSIGSIQATDGFLLIYYHHAKLALLAHFPLLKKERK
jgi:hypothetical protein